VQQAFASGQGSSTRYSSTVGYQMMYAAARIGSSEAPAGVVRIAVPLREVHSSLAHLRNALLGASLVTAILAVLLSTWIASRTTRPLRRLTEATAQLAAGDLSTQVIPSSRDEVGQLTHTFNAMSQQLQSHIQALETERSKLAAILAEMSDGVLIVDEQGWVQMINPAAQIMFGASTAAGHAYTLAELVRHYQLVDLWKRSQTSPEPQIDTIELGARRLYLQCVATQFGAALPGATLMLIQDLTRLRRLETVRRDFVSNISHELRTPLASLKALTETLLEGALDDPPAAQRFLLRMETEVDALSLMVSELLELARIESGRVPLQMRVCSACDVIADAVERLRLQAERSGLVLTIECETDLPRIIADPPRLEQVIVNLIHNAIKFTPAGGTIQVTARSKDGNILIIVKDSGVGIHGTDLPRIFERFYKSDRARSGGGAGLGLAIARHMIESHGGKIWAESSPGQGSTFFIRLPQAP
jgi:two-component system, OmpR family, phosphate regulon sensor histidine kinase PhoR